MSLPPGPAGEPVPSVALVVLDGWGLAPEGPGNAVSQAKTPVFDELWGGYPRTTLSTSGRDVGLPPGQMGNSEVGHLNLGAGAIVKQDLARIDDAIADGSFFENPALRDACGAARESRRGRLHAIGLVSDGGVHSGWESHRGGDRARSRRGRHRARPSCAHRRARHPAPRRGRLSRGGRALAAAGRPDRHGRRPLLGDGPRPPLGPHQARLRRDRPRPRAAGGDGGCGGRAPPTRREITDEFIEPTVIGDYDGAAADEPVIFINFRPDRARQLTMALGDPDFDGIRPRGSADVRGDDDDRVPPRLALPGRLPAEGARDDARRGDRGAGRAPAPRRRDREVRARHLLLQWRARAGVERGGALSRRLAARRPHLRPQAGDERRRRRRACSPSTGGTTATASGSSTSPTPTWSGTPA